MKTRFTLMVALSLISATTVFSQEEIAGNLSQNKSMKLSQTKAPSFVGGDMALAQYLQDNIEYPDLARKQGIEGTVVVEYYIDIDGSIENILIVKSVSSEIDGEAIRLVKNMPNWNPGMHNGQPERICYQLPIKFTLNP